MTYIAAVPFNFWPFVLSTLLLIMTSHMSIETSFLRKCLTTRLTFKRFNPRMSHIMRFEVKLEQEPLATELTREGLNPRVLTSMQVKAAFLCETLLALATFEEFFLAVGELMSLEGQLAGKAFLTCLTAERPLSGMLASVQVQAAFLRETFLALVAFKEFYLAVGELMFFKVKLAGKALLACLTAIRLLSSVYPKMYLKRCHLREEFVAKDALELGLALLAFFVEAVMDLKLYFEIKRSVAKVAFVYFFPVVSQQVLLVACFPRKAFRAEVALVWHDVLVKIGVALQVVFCSQNFAANIT